MNSREKFISVLENKSITNEYINLPKIEFGYWAGTIRRWFSEGLPVISSLNNDISDGLEIKANRNITEKEKPYSDLNVQPYFNLDYNLSLFPFDYSPMIEKEVLKKTDTYIIYRDSYGVVHKNDISMSSLPLEIQNPIVDWSSWGSYKKHYGADTIGKRIPKDWKAIVEFLKNRDFPIRLGRMPAGFFGYPRLIMGLENFLMKLYDEPKLIHDIMDTLLEFLIKYYSIILKDVDIDAILIWEDMSGKQGSLISPKHFKEFISPRYRELIKTVKKLGVNNILVDTDGFVGELIPLMLETGVTGMYPFEIAAGNDLHEIRKDFPDFQIIGGVDKRILFEGSNKKNIDRELEGVKKLIEKGRYIPHIDHYVSPDCVWENFKYYREKLNSIIDDYNH